MPGASRTSSWVAVSAVCVLVLAAASASASAPASSARSVAPSTRLHVTVTLGPRDPAALAAYAQAVSDPSSSAFHHYLTPRQFATRFGATRAQIALVRRSLRARGLRPGPASTGGLSIPLYGTAGRLERGLSIPPRRLSGRAGRSAMASAVVSALAAATGGAVQAIVGLDPSPAPRPLLVRSGARASAAAARRLRSAHLTTGGPQPCAQATSVAAAENAHTADQIASAYGFSGLYGTGDQGAGVTVAIYELEPNSRSDIAAYQDCYGTGASIGYVPVDGGAGTGPGSGEAALDIENLIGLAPAANVLVYQGPNSDSSAPRSGPYDTFSAIVNQDRAQVVSVSWGQCESALTPGSAAAENTLFQQAAVQGQSIVAAAGDSGSEDCDTGAPLPQTGLAVDDPAAQPYTVGVGGTTLSSLGPRPAESAWNSGGSTVSGLLQAGAGGGGISNTWPMPAGQLGAAPSLGVLGAAPNGAACGRPGGYCREVPDVSADADPSSGYLIYWNGGGGDAGQPAGWQSIGGTSAAAPVWSALLALADASTLCAGSPVGFAAPALYRAAGDAYAGDFNDVRSGDNDFTATNGGRYAAATGYDEATGLGTPNAAALATGLCTDTLRLAAPGDQRSAAHASVSLRLRATDGAGATITFAITGLPAGLSVDPSDGRITGRPRRTGSFAVAVTAQDGQGAAAVRSFTWTVGGAPRVARAALSGLRHRQPALSFRVSSGRGAPPLRRLLVTLPGDLRLTSARAVQLTARGVRRPRFAARLVHGDLDIRLARPLAEVGVALSYPQLRTAGRDPHARRSGPAGSELRLRILDAGIGTVRLRAGLTRSG